MTDTDDGLTYDDLPQPEYEGEIDVDDLKVDGSNPNEMDDANFDALVERMENQGWLGGAILTDTDNVLADGEHRLKAARELGLDTVPVKQYNWTDAERRLVRLEMNKNQGEHSAHDDALEYDYILERGHSDRVDRLGAMDDQDVESMLDDLLSSGDDADLPDGSEANDPYDEWDESGTTEYENENRLPEFSVKVHCQTKDDLDEFAELLGKTIDEDTRYVYFPESPPKADLNDKEYVAQTDD